MDDLEELINHLVQTTRLERAEARRVVREVTAFCSETVEQYVVRRHLELQADRLTNPAIFERLSEEIEARRFRAGTFSARQLRRIVYG
jgi:hypothetical protein